MKKATKEKPPLEHFRFFTPFKINSLFLISSITSLFDSTIDKRHFIPQKLILSS
jgi:hypothetical protein